jgi:hypothetical protein
MMREPNVGGVARRDCITEMNLRGICGSFDWERPQHLALRTSPIGRSVVSVAIAEQAAELEGVCASSPGSAATSTGAPASTA